MRRICAVLSIAVGVLMISAPVVTRLFDRTAAAQRLTNTIRPAMTTQSLDHLRSDFDAGRAAGLQLINQALPSVAAQLGETPAQLNATIQAQYPDVASGFQQFPGIATKVDGVLTLFEKDQGEFHAADSTPTSWLPFTVGPWLMVLLGLGLIVIGLLTLRGGRPLTLLVIGVAGAALVVGPLAVSFPHKTAQSASLVDDLRPLITRPVADTVKGWQSTMEKMTAQLDGQLLPDLAAQLHETPAQLTASWATNYPAVATGLPRLKAIFVNFADKTKRLDTSVSDFAKTKQIPYRTLPWLFIPPGAVLVMGAAAAIAADRRRSSKQSSTVAPSPAAASGTTASAPAASSAPAATPTAGSAPTASEAAPPEMEAAGAASSSPDVSSDDAARQSQEVS